MNRIELANSWAGPWLGMALTRVIPLRLAYRLADRMAQSTASHVQTPSVQAVRANQAVVRGLAYDDPLLGEATEAVFRTALRANVDFFRAAGRGLPALLEACRLDDAVLNRLGREAYGRRGGVVVGAHMAGFDIMLPTVPARGYDTQALSFPEPRGSYSVQNMLRRRFGLNLTPLSTKALKEALHRLRNSGVVLTGVDRPIGEGESLMFFGRPAKLPVGAVRLAVAAKALLVVIALVREGDGRYRVSALEVIDTRELPEPERDARTLAQRVLLALEKDIRKRPEQWLMFHPVWPEVLPGGGG